MKTVKRRFYIMILAIITIFLAIPIFMNNFNCYIDEGIHYIARSFASSQVGVFSKVVPEFANGFGYTWSLFTGNLSIIVLSLLYRIFIFDFVALNKPVSSYVLARSEDGFIIIFILLGDTND